MSPISSATGSKTNPNPPPWEVLKLVADHLDPKTLAIGSSVAKSWFDSMSSDHLWKPICLAHYPGLSTLKVADPSVPYRRLFSVGYTATKRRMKPPPTPCISLDNLVFAFDLRAKDAKYFTVAKPVNELCADPNGVFRFDFDVDHECFGLFELQEEVKITWTVVLGGWQGVFTMMDCEGRLNLSPTTEGWFSEELPSPRCCSSEDASGIVADLKVGFRRKGESGDDYEKVRVKYLCLGMLNAVNWRYVNIDDALRYLQHFLVPNTNNM